MLEGEINEMNLVERLVEFWREEFTGAIRFESDGIIKIVYFKSGDILSASTNDRADSIDEILMRAGKVSRDHVKQALAKRKESETLGDALLNLGFITRKELTWARRVQVVGVIRSIAAWTEGSFTIVADYLPKRDEGTLFPVPQVLVELIVTDQDRAHVERALDGGNAVYSRTADFDDVFRKLGLNEEAEAIVAQIDGERSASEVATASGGETFNVYKLLHALATLGILVRNDKPRVEPQFSVDDFASAGVADAADMWGFDPDPPSAPTFELDEAEAARQPTLEISIPEPEPDVPSYEETHSINDSDDEFANESTAPASDVTPGWDAPPREPIAIPAPAMIEPPADAQEEQWGFDEAQIETARRAEVPVNARERQRTSIGPARRTKSRSALIVGILALLAVGGAGYFGYLWWQGRDEVSAAELVRGPAAAPARGAVPAAVPAPVPAPVPEPARAAADPTQTIVEENAAAGETAAAPQLTAPAPPVAGGRARFDEMARAYAANPRGAYTVQIQILCDPANVQKAISAGGDNVWFVPQPLGGRPCYRLFWGNYATQDEARRAMASIPAALRDRTAAVKPVPRG